MIKLVLEEIITAVCGRTGGDVPAFSVTGVSTDSRSACAGELFFAIHGPRFDGHDFVGAAMQRGAVAAVIASSKTLEVKRALDGAARPTASPAVLIMVDDPVQALARLGAYHRRQLSADVVAVVGSNGKTTTKAMIDHILGGRLKGRASPKSFNNQIGVPLTLLSGEAPDDYLVVEIGTNSPGEIAALAELAEPNLAVLTCVGEEHLEGLRNLDGVIEEECAVFRKLRAGGFAAVNVDTPRVSEHVPDNGLTLVTFGQSPEADLRWSAARYKAPWLRFRINERFDYRLRIAGVHNAANAAGAIAIARRFGFEHDEIAARLETFVAPPMRMEVLEVEGVTVINDAYNANPQSALAAIEVLETAECTGRRVLVFGEMRELGPHGAALHRKIAERLAGGKVDRVILVGSAGEWMYDVLSEARLFGPRVERSADVDECVELLVDELRAGDALLLKASRAVGLERIIEPLRRRLTAISAA